MSNFDHDRLLIAYMLGMEAGKGDRRAPWLAAAHTLCTDMGIAQGHIGDRIKALRAACEGLRAEADPQALTIAYLNGSADAKKMFPALVKRVRERCAQTAEAYEPRCDTCPAGVANAIRSIPIEELLK